MKISLIVAIYNMTRLYKDKCICFDSIINQTLSLSDIEIVAVDDCSTDHSIEILKRYKAEYPDLFHLVHNEENMRDAGISGMANAKGEYVFFLDQDDWLAPDCLEKMLALAESRNADMVCCDYYTTYRQNYDPVPNVSSFDIETGQMNRPRYKKMMINCGHITGKLFRRSRFLEMDGTIKSFFTEKTYCCYGDNCKWPLIILSMNSIEYVKKPLYFYYKNPYSVTGSFSERQFKERLDSERIMYRRVNEAGVFNDYFDEVEFLFVNVFYVNSLLMLPMNSRKNIRYSKDTAKSIKQEVKEKFPNFQKNLYYREKTKTLQKIWVQIDWKSDLAFIVLYFIYYWIRLGRNSIRDRNRRKTVQLG